MIKKILILHSGEISIMSIDKVVRSTISTMGVCLYSVYQYHPPKIFQLKVCVNMVDDLFIDMIIGISDKIQPVAWAGVVSDIIH